MLEQHKSCDQFMLYTIWLTFKYHINFNLRLTIPNNNDILGGQGNTLDDGLMFWLIASFNNILVISWQSALLVAENGIPGENRRPPASH